jgi:hypothetical protein
MKQSLKRLTASIALTAPLIASANTIYQPDNILVSHHHVLYEYHEDGTLVSQHDIPKNENLTGNEFIQHITVLDNGNLAVVNGMAQPDLSIYDGTNWSTIDVVEGWSATRNLSYGGIANIGNYIFLTDNNTPDGGEPEGLIRVNLEDNTSTRFIDTTGYVDVTVGQDGLLYATRNRYGDLDVISPETLAVLRSVKLDFEARSATANAEGEIYATVWDGYLAKYDANGGLLNTLQIAPQGIHDIEIHTDDRIVATGHNGDVYLTDTSLSTFAQVAVFEQPNMGSHVAFVPGVTAPTEPTLQGSHYIDHHKVVTTLNWETSAESVDIYLNGYLLDSNSTASSATYAFSIFKTQVFQVCNSGTTECSEEYTANVKQSFWKWLLDQLTELDHLVE